MITTNEIKNGIVLQIDGDLLQVTDFQHVLQNKVAYVRVKFKNLRTGSSYITTMNPGVKVNDVDINHTSMQYLYSDGSFYTFMNTEDYSQIQVPCENLKWESQFMLEGSMVIITSYNDEVLGVQLPDKIELEVTESSPAVAGNTATSALKEVKVETGLTVKVPMFIKQGEKIIVSTIDASYKGRA
jgi:elongation factor P